MILTDLHKQYIDQSVLCWLATADQDGQPNVSPKELFTYYEDHFLQIAQIASPQSIANIRHNPKVCVSFIEVFVQKGFKIRGTARLITKRTEGFEERSQKLREMAGARFSVNSLIEITVDAVDPIIAPSYRLYPETTEADQIQSGLKTYRIDQYIKGS